MLTATVEADEALRPQPEMVIELVTAARRPGSFTSVPLVPEQLPPPEPVTVNV